MSRAKLREISTFGWLQEGIGALGVFFVSGAFWTFITLISEHSDEWRKYLPWFILCGCLVVAGLGLIWVGYRHFKLKQDCIEEIFRNSDDD